MRAVKPTRYSIVVEGELGPRFEAAFGAMELEVREGVTAIVGRIEDQAQLQGVLDRIAALGLSLLSVTPLESEAGRSSR